MKPKPDEAWLAKAKAVIEAVAGVYSIDEIRVNVGPLGSVRSLNISWGGQYDLSYISLALPNDGVIPSAYQTALERDLYGERP